MLLFFVVFLFTLGLVPFVFFNFNTTEIKQVLPVYSVADTSWVASDGSEMVFKQDDFKWYQHKDEYDDNYYSGTYEFYFGEKAVDYITTELKQYGVTKSELEDLFERNEEYSENNFVVFDLKYDAIVVGGETSIPDQTLVPWYGFILEDGTYLDVANMNTGTYYKFSIR